MGVVFAASCAAAVFVIAMGARLVAGDECTVNEWFVGKGLRYVGRTGMPTCLWL